jgi:hypothetical protein
MATALPQHGFHAEDCPCFFSDCYTRVTIRRQESRVAVVQVLGLLPLFLILPWSLIFLPSLSHFPNHIPN